MKFVFVSNYLTHHQIPFCEDMYRLNNGEFEFIETQPMEEERISMKWNSEFKYPYIRKVYDSYELQKIVDESDILIIGTVADRVSFEKRMNINALTFIYSERRAKKSDLQLFSYKARTFVKKKYGAYFLKNMYLLCAGGFTALDYQTLGAFKGKCLKWGYFPEVKYYDIDKLMERKSNNAPSILWAGRLIKWKHPEASIIVAERLRNTGYLFQMNIIGSGIMDTELKRMIVEKHLQDYVHILGSMTPDKVREYMEKANVFLVTSDRNEGWGAVINESMNSGCAVIAGNMVGSSPYLIKNGKNGFVYKSENWNELGHLLEKMCKNPEICKQIGKMAYSTIVDEWNSEKATERIIAFSASVQSGNKNVMSLYADGICSKDDVRRKNWFKGEHL